MYVCVCTYHTCIIYVSKHVCMCMFIKDLKEAMQTSINTTLSTLNSRVDEASSVLGEALSASETRVRTDLMSAVDVVKKDAKNDVDTVRYFYFIFYIYILLFIYFILYIFLIVYFTCCMLCFIF